MTCGDLGEFIGTPRGSLEAFVKNLMDFYTFSHIHGKSGKEREVGVFFKLMYIIYVRENRRSEY